jgi:hypothetical protein
MTYIPTSDYYHLVQSGRVPGVSVVNKFGRNQDVDSGTEDIWNGGGLYTGFPTGAPEELQVFSSSASDTGTLTFLYLASSNATEWQTATVTMNGTTAVNTGITAYRCHTAFYNSGSGTTLNAGDITIRHRTTTANVFQVLEAGRGQTNAAVYTIPAGHTGYIKRLFGEVVGGTSSNNVDYALWVREFGAGPRLRRPHTTNEGDRFDEPIYGGVVLPAKADIKMQATVTGNNLRTIGGFDILIEADA